MEPRNHPIERKIIWTKPSIFRFHPLIFQGRSLRVKRTAWEKVPLKNGRQNEDRYRYYVFLLVGFWALFCFRQLAFASCSLVGFWVCSKKLVHQPHRKCHSGKTHWIFPSFEKQHLSWRRMEYRNTLPETNIAMEYPPFWWYLLGNMGIFRCYVSFGEGISLKPKSDSKSDPTQMDFCVAWWILESPKPVFFSTKKQATSSYSTNCMLLQLSNSQTVSDPLSPADTCEDLFPFCQGGICYTLWN